MNKIDKKKVITLLSMLNDEEKKEDILKINETTNKNIYDYLNEQGILQINYEIVNPNIYRISETGGIVYFWNKTENGFWEINLYQIHRMLNLKWIL